MKILALDIATNTGCAVGEIGGVPRAWSYNLGASKPYPERFARMIQLLEVIRDEHNPDFIAIEAPISGPKAHQVTTGLWAVAMGWACRHGIPAQDYGIDRIRKHFMGKPMRKSNYVGTDAQKTKQLKAEIMGRCRLLGWAVEDDDAGDAAATWDYACALQSRAHQMKTVGGLFREQSTFND